MPPILEASALNIEGGWINGSAIVGTKRVPSTIVHALAVQIFCVVGVACAVRSTNILNNVVIFFWTSAMTNMRIVTLPKLSVHQNYSCIAHA